MKPWRRPTGPVTTAPRQSTKVPHEIPSRLRLVCDVYSKFCWLVGLFSGASDQPIYRIYMRTVWGGPYSVILLLVSMYTYRASSFAVSRSQCMLGSCEILFLIILLARLLLLTFRLCATCTHACRLYVVPLTQRDAMTTDNTHNEPSIVDDVGVARTCRCLVCTSAHACMG